MLLSMRARVEVGRALCYYALSEIDHRQRCPDPGRAELHRRRVDLLTPIVKGWCTEAAVEVASTGMQVHGGMGYVEETGAAQFLRDVRICPIYEGTTGIQANDLMSRKVLGDNGREMQRLLDEMRAEVRAWQAARALPAPVLEPVAAAVERLEALSRHLVDSHRGAPHRALAVAFPFLQLCAESIGCWLLARGLAGARSAGQELAELRPRLVVARFHAEHYLSRGPALESIVRGGEATIMELAADEF
jgi:hypothetical protein